MTLDEALEPLPLDVQKQFEDRFRILAEHLALGYQAVSNFRSESRLPQETWEALLRALLSPDPEPGAIKKAITDCFLSRTLRGPELTPPWPAVFGRAVTLDRFCRLLFRFGKYSSVTTARRAVRNMLSKAQDVVAQRWRNYEMGRYLMWSTFDAATSTANPFEGISNTADAIAGLLGLDRNERGRPLLLLTYTLPASVAPRFPTVAEAYAGGVWPYFFRPASPGAPYGMTMPWPEYQHEAPRPEVVHEVIRGAQLAAPLRQVL